MVLIFGKKRIIKINLQKNILLTAAFLLGFSMNSLAQIQTSPVLEGSNLRPLTVSGSVGLSANMYRSWGIQNRRAPASFQTEANLNFSVFGLSSGLDLMYSTDQSKLRQNLNSLGFNASWKWLTVQVGDVSPNFSKYGLNGATLRGGDVKLNPGNWQLELSGGRSKRRVAPSNKPGFRETSFKRMSFAGKIGYEKGDNHYFISSHYSVDKNESFESPVNDTPKENLTVTPNVQVNLLSQALTFSGQFTVSAFTRDLNSPKIPGNSINIPGFLTGIMRPHTSSRLNYAGQVSADLEMDQFGLKLDYERVQPGFNSLGVGRVRDDQQQIRISPSFQLFQNKLTFQGNLSLRRDNLLGTRLQTQKNTNVGTNIQLSLTNQININANYNLLINNISSDASSGSSTTQGVAIGQKQVNHTLSLQPSLTFRNDNLTHSISLTGSYYTLTNKFKGNQSLSRQQINTNTYSGAINYSLSFGSGLSLNTSANFLKNNSNASKSTSMGANIGGSYSLFDRKLTLSFNSGINQIKNKITSSGQSRISTKARQLMFNLTGNYQLSNKDSFSLSVRNRYNTVLRNSGTTYAELEGSFNYQHRF